ncbi:MAG TPA: DUF3341 domain-containing protein [Balneolales bacterium]|nr:DUF3341 domain-containing protein [Balneolales bacterium]
METKEKNKLHGILAEFKNPAALLHAAETVNNAGYSKFDTFSPFPIHGMDEAMSLKKSKVGWIVLGFGLVGLFGAITLMVWVMSSAMPVSISAKPLVDPPIYVPITFELTVLLSSFGAVTGMLLLNGLPKPHNPLFNSENFNRATDDGFFLYIESKDALFSEDKTADFLEEAKALNIEKIYD